MARTFGGRFLEGEASGLKEEGRQIDVTAQEEGESCVV
jgi:hypothetical protein